MFKDYYKILSIHRNADMDEIKKSYRLLARQYHPDKNPGLYAIEKMQEINEAYDVLGDLKKKDWYDHRYDNRQPNTTIQTPVHKHTSPKPTKRKNRKNKSFTYENYARNGKVLATFVCLFSILLIIDYPFASTYNATVVEKAEVVMRKSRRGPSEYFYTIVSSKVNFTVCTSTDGIKEGDVLDVKITPVFGIVKTIKNTATKISPTTIATVYFPFGFFIIAALGAGIAALRIKAHEHSFRFSIASGIFLCIVVYFIEML